MKILILIGVLCLVMICVLVGVYVANTQKEQ